MAVYVDDVQYAYGRMKMCHLWADTEEELFRMVDAIGVARKWVQRPPRASWLHFDICLSKKALALKHGAVLTDKYGPVEHCAREDIASGVAARVKRGNKMLELVNGSRALYGTRRRLAHQQPRAV